MATNIGNLVVKLTANASGFMTTFAKASRQLSALGSEVAGTVGKIGGIGAALTAAVTGGGFAMLVKNQMEAIDATAKLADRLGMTTEALSGMQYAASLAGVSNESLAGGFQKMLNSIGRAATEGGAAADAFKRLGLDAASVANMPTDEAFKTIAQSLAGINNPAERARAAVEIFGKSGQDLLPLMLQGAKGIEAAQAEAEKLGLTFSRVDAAKVEQANDAITRLQSVFIGIGRTLAIQLAPFIEAVAKYFTDAAASGEGMGQRVLTAFEWMLTGVAKLADWLELLKAVFYGLKTTIAGVFYYAIKLARQFADGLLTIISYIPGLGDAVDQARAAFDGLEEGMSGVATESAGEMQEAWRKFSNGENSAAVKRAFDEIRANSQRAAQQVADDSKRMSGGMIDAFDEAAEEAAKRAKEVAEKLAAMREEVATMGMNDAEKAIRGLAANGATSQQLAEAQNLLTQKAEFEQAKKQMDELRQSADRVRESVKTPMQAYEEEIGRLNEVLRAGLISWEEYGAAVRNAKATLEASGPKAPNRVEAMRGAAAQRFVYEARTGTRDTLAQKSLQAEERTAKAVETMERNSSQRAVISIGGVS